MLPNAVRPGAVLAGKYRLVECLGRGGMGQVWRADDLMLGAMVAVKVIDPERLEADETRGDVIARFLHEAQAAAALRSAHVVQILQYGVDPSQVPFMAMELLEGETLAQRLARLRVPPYADTSRIVTHVARAMARAHELGIVHRDLKPDNVFLTRNDDEELAKVMDFGIAKRLAGALPDQGASLTRTGRVVGTPAYMSPEQTVGKQPVDARSDLWSLGVIAYECVVGRRPFQGRSLGELTLQIVVQDLPVPSKHAKVPPGFDAWFARAVNRDPQRRFQSARELAESLRAVLLQPGLPAPEGKAGDVAKGLDTERALATSNTPLIPIRRARRLVIGLVLGAGTGAAVLAFVIWKDNAHRFTTPDPGASSVTPSVAVAPVPTPTSPPASASASASPQTDAANPVTEASADTATTTADPAGSAAPPRAREAPGTPPPANPYKSVPESRPRQAPRPPDEGASKDPRLGF